MTTCAWRVANPDKPHGGSGTYCWGWSCRTDPKTCSRKAHAAQKRKAEQAAFRKFPGSPYQQARQARWDAAVAEQQAVARGAHLTDAQWALVRAAGAHQPGHCTWCGDQIRSVKNPAALDLRRTWHSGKGREPDCLLAYYLHTRADTQLPWLRANRGPVCAGCGERPGAQVDHRLALSLVVLLILPPYRWAYWGPGNLQLLCHPCHVAKTRQDVADLKALRKRLAGPEVDDQPRLV